MHDVPMSSEILGVIDKKLHPELSSDHVNCLPFWQGWGKECKGHKGKESTQVGDHRQDRALENQLDSSPNSCFTSYQLCVLGNILAPGACFLFSKRSLSSSCVMFR